MKVAIIQARSGSSRLPGKVLKNIQGKPVLSHVIDRARAIPGLDAVWCAIPDNASDDAVADLAAKNGAGVARGPEQDVLERYLIAARMSDASVVVRVTSDCPLLDPAVSGAVLARLVDSGAAYVSNVDPRSWPKGFDTEAMSRDWLERMGAEATDPYDREHVTPWLRRAPDARRHNVPSLDGDFSGWRWTLDYEEDLAFIRAVYALLPAEKLIRPFAEMRRLIAANPSIAAINAHLS